MAAPVGGGRRRGPNGPCRSNGRISALVPLASGGSGLGQLRNDGVGEGPGNELRCDVGELAVVIPGVVAQPGERLVHRDPGSLRQGALRLLDGHPAVERALELGGDLLGARAWAASASMSGNTPASAMNRLSVPTTSARSRIGKACTAHNIVGADNSKPQNDQGDALPRPLDAEQSCGWSGPRATLIRWLSVHGCPFATIQVDNWCSRASPETPVTRTKHSCNPGTMQCVQFTSMQRARDIVPGTMTRAARTDERRDIPRWPRAAAATRRSHHVIGRPTRRCSLGR